MAWGRDRLRAAWWTGDISKLKELGLGKTTNDNLLSALSFARRGADTAWLLLITDPRVD